MPAVTLGTGSYRRKDAAQAPILVRNLFVEPDPTNLVDGKAHIQRGGLVSFGELSQGPIRGMAQQDGIFNGDIVVISGNLFSRVNSTGVQNPINVFPAGGTVQTVFGEPGRTLSVGTDGSVWGFSGGSLTQVVTPDSVPIQSVAYLNGYFILAGQQSQHVFWIDPGSTDPDPLNFFSAESQADQLVAVVALADDLWIFGTSSIEVWSPSGNADLPFTRSAGRLYSKGCAARDTVAKVDNTLFWVGQDRIAYRADTVPIRISDNTIEEYLRNEPGANMRAWSFSRDGHTFYVLTIGAQGTFAFDVSTSLWSQWSSYGHDYWRAHLGVQIDGRTIVAGDSDSAKLWKVDPSVSNDDGQPIIREIMGAVGVLTQNARCNSIELVAARGRGSSYVTPVNLQVCWSDDEGETWTAWRSMNLGKKGQYSVVLTLKALGRMSAPGRIFWFRLSDDSVLRFSYARMNEGAGQ